MVMEEAVIWLGYRVVELGGCRGDGVVWVEVGSPINISKNVQWQRTLHSKRIEKSIKLLCHINNEGNKNEEKYMDYAGYVL